MSTEQRRNRSEGRRIGKDNMRLESAYRHLYQRCLDDYVCGTSLEDISRTHNLPICEVGKLLYKDLQWQDKYIVFASETNAGKTVRQIAEEYYEPSATVGHLVGLMKLPEVCQSNLRRRNATPEAIYRLLSSNSSFELFSDSELDSMTRESRWTIKLVGEAIANATSG